MINYSKLNKVNNKYIKINFILLIALITGCYSFTGGSIPEYLKTLYIATVTDNSGFGDPKYRDALTQLLVQKFRNDNSFSLVEKNGDARLDVVISSVKEEPLIVKPGVGQELESERKVTVILDAEYYDGIKKKQFWKKSFSAFGTFDISKNPQQGREKAIKTALEQTADDILLAVVSGW